MFITKLKSHSILSEQMLESVIFTERVASEAVKDAV